MDSVAYRHAVVGLLLLIVSALCFAFTRKGGALNPEEVTMPSPITPAEAAEAMEWETTKRRASKCIEVLVAAQADQPDLPHEERVRPEHIVQVFESLLPELFIESLRDPNINEEWLPSRESLAYWVQEHRLGQIAELGPDYVRSLFEDENGDVILEGPDSEYANYVLALDGQLNEQSFGWPVDMDLDRMWNSQESRGLYEEVLQAKHYADLADDALWARLEVMLEEFGPRVEGDEEAWIAFREADELYTDYRDLRGTLWSNEEQWRSALWRSDKAYPHWSFLMRVADRHFQ